jgi:hypothetical protein
MPERRSLSLVQLITLSLSKLSLLQRMACNDNDKRKLEEEAESLTARKRLRLFDDDASDDDSYDSPGEEMKEEQETEEEVSSEETLMNKLHTSKEKLSIKRGCGMIFSDDGDTTSSSSELCNPKSHWRSDEDSSDDDDDDDFWI